MSTAPVLLSEGLEPITYPPTIAEQVSISPSEAHKLVMDPPSAAQQSSALRDPLTSVYPESVVDAASVSEELSFSETLPSQHQDAVVGSPVAREPLASDGLLPSLDHELVMNPPFAIQQPAIGSTPLNEGQELSVEPPSMTAGPSVEDTPSEDVRDASTFNVTLRGTDNQPTVHISRLSYDGDSTDDSPLSDFEGPPQVLDGISEAEQSDPTLASGLGYVPQTRPVDSISSSAKTTPTTAPAIVKFKALFPWVAETADDLSFFAGDIIELVDEQDSMWRLGSVRGNIGLFPANYVEQVNEFSDLPAKPTIIQVPSPQTPNSLNRRLVEHRVPVVHDPPSPSKYPPRAQKPLPLAPASKRCLAAWDYNQDNLLPGHLSFSSGDIIEMVETSSSQWWSGVVHGRRGLFPADYVKRGISTTLQWKALQAYNEDGLLVDRLSFSAGDIIKIVDMTFSEWWLGTVHGKTAIFPAHCVLTNRAYTPGGGDLAVASKSASIAFRRADASPRRKPDIESVLRVTNDSGSASSRRPSSRRQPPTEPILRPNVDPLNQLHPVPSLQLSAPSPPLQGARSVPPSIPIVKSGRPLPSVTSLAKDTPELEPSPRVSIDYLDTSPNIEEFLQKWRPSLVLSGLFPFLCSTVAKQHLSLVLYLGVWIVDAHRAPRKFCRIMTVCRIIPKMYRRVLNIRKLRWHLLHSAITRKTVRASRITVLFLFLICGMPGDRRVDPQDAQKNPNPATEYPEVANAPTSLSNYQKDRDCRVDRLGEELAADSSIWSTYGTASSAYDAAMVNAWNENLDALLIFASLFSAVVTAFVIQASQSLQPDYSEKIALLIAQMSHVLANPANKTYLASLQTPEEILSFAKPLWAKVVNTLWFSALGFSLSGVLVAMLAKQWLVTYTSERQEEPSKYAYARQRRFDALHRWYLPDILLLLPALLHSSLFLFLVGLVIYMWQLDSALFQITGFILAILFVFYIASGTLAMFSSNCPYNTPMSQILRSCFPGNRKQAISSESEDLPRAVMWLATTKDPKAVSAALQSLAGLRRGFMGYEARQAHYLAMLALEQLRGCFVAEWQHTAAYSLRFDKQYEASCYARTLMHFVDDPRADHSSFESILADQALPSFLQLLAQSKDKSVALLALCDYQRLLHHQVLTKWASFRSRKGSHNTGMASSLLRGVAMKQNLARIIALLEHYLASGTFLHPFTIEIAVETIACAPLPWVEGVVNRDVLFEEILNPLFDLLCATRDGVSGVRRAIARTFAILSDIHGFIQHPALDDLGPLYENALSIAAAHMVGDGSPDTTRNLLLLALSHFVKVFAEADAPALDCCNALFYECDRRSGSEDASFSDHHAVIALLPLLNAPLDDSHKTQILDRLLHNAISAAPGYGVPQSSILYNIIPLDPFPSNAVSVLLETLERYRDTGAQWLRQLSGLLYILTRETSHQQHFLAEASAFINVIRGAASEELAVQVFWILTVVVSVTVSSISQDTTPLLLEALLEYSARRGLTPADVHMWCITIPLLPLSPSETLSRQLLLDSLYSIFEAQEPEQRQRLSLFRQPLLPFAEKSTEHYTPVSALQALRRVREAYASQNGSRESRWFPRLRDIVDLDV